MTVTTKFDVGSKVFFMWSNKVLEGEVIKLHSNQDDFPDINWIVNSEGISREVGRNGVYLPESRLFATKEELLKSL